MSLSSSAFRRQEPAPNDGPSDTDAARSRADKAHGRELLESVLRQTLEHSDSGTPLDDADQEALAQVAGHHLGEPLTLEPVAVELVEAVLILHFQGLADAPAFWRHVAVQVAETLLGDPVMQRRLEELWRNLCRAES